MILYDLKAGTLQSKRHLLLIIITVLQCMLVQIRYDQMLISAPDVEYSLREMIFGIFAGCESMLKSGVPAIPYGWIAVFVCLLFIPFDYMRQDLSHFGSQILLRTKKRTLWWCAKCLWNILSSIAGYAVILATAAVFCLAAGIPVTLSDNPDAMMLLAPGFSYQAFGISSLSAEQVFLLIISPLLAIITLNLMQMLLSLMMKPLYSFAVMIGILMLSVTVSWGMAFPRLGMVMYHDTLYKGGYAVQTGIITCLIVILFSICGGRLYFKKYDVLPEREAS